MVLRPIVLWKTLETVMTFTKGEEGNTNKSGRAASGRLSNESNYNIATVNVITEADLDQERPAHSLEELTDCFS